MNNKKKNNPQQVGVTPENVRVIDGVFRWFDTNGTPLDIIFDMCREKNLMPSWTHFYSDARKQGWSHETIINRLRDNISDVWGKEFSDNVLERVEIYSRTLYIEEMNK